jgi:transcriptional antiterminator NusG
LLLKEGIMNIHENEEQTGEVEPIEEVQDIVEPIDDSPILVNEGQEDDLAQDPPVAEEDGIQDEGVPQEIEIEQPTEEVDEETEQDEETVPIIEEVITETLSEEEDEIVNKITAEEQADIPAEPQEVLADQVITEKSVSDTEEDNEVDLPDPYRERIEVEPVIDDGRVWYVVHCYSGNEDKVRHNIMQRIESMSMDDLIFDVVVPTEDEVNIKNGERQTVEKKVFPGYILVYMILTEESWYMVRNTPGVTGFVGMGNDPTPLQPEEVARILKRMESESPRINVTFRAGERVRIVDGPFEDFYGKVAEIDMDRAIVRVMANFFGRETPVELDFLQVEEA